MAKRKTAKKLAEEKKQRHQAFLSGLQRIFSLKADFMIVNYFQISFQDLGFLIRQGKVPQKIKKMILSELRTSSNSKKRREISLFIKRWGKEYDISDYSRSKKEEGKETVFYSKDDVSRALTKSFQKALQSKNSVCRQTLLDCLLVHLPKSKITMSKRTLLFFDETRTERDFFEIPKDINVN